MSPWLLKQMVFRMTNKHGHNTESLMRVNKKIVFIDKTRQWELISKK